MIAWLLLIVYVVGYALAFVRIARAIGQDMCDDMADQMMCLFLASLFAFLWPLILVFVKIRERVFGEGTE